MMRGLGGGSKDPILFTGGQGNLYVYVGNDPVNGDDITGLAVEICRELAQTPILNFLGIQHQWIRTDTKEAGILGTWLDTSIQGHPGFGDQPGSTCTAVPQVDEDCVNRHLALGQETGPWLPWSNCATFVSDVIRACSAGSMNAGAEGAGAF